MSKKIVFSFFILIVTFASIVSMFFVGANAGERYRNSHLDDSYYIYKNDYFVTTAIHNTETGTRKDNIKDTIKDTIKNTTKDVMVKISTDTFADVTADTVPNTLDTTVSDTTDITGAHDNITDAPISSELVSNDAFQREHDPNAKYVALTFDDGPNHKTTSKLLDILKEHNAKATFFIVGQRVSGNESLIKRIYDEGHSIGNHSYNHSSLANLNSDNMNYQIAETNSLIENITDHRPVLLRPPYGDYNAAVSAQAKAQNMSLILWNVDPKDWKVRNVNKIYEHVLSYANDGDIIIMHDLYDESVGAVEKIISTLSEKGFVFVTVDELITKSRDLEPGYVYLSE